VVCITDTSGARHSFSGAIKASLDCRQRVARDFQWCVTDVRRLADSVSSDIGADDAESSQLSKARTGSVKSDVPHASDVAAMRELMLAFRPKKTRLANRTTFWRTTPCHLPEPR
jgi:hypothetical protein